MDADIYIDVVFFINLVMDLLIFAIAGKLANLKIRFLRLLLGSAVSAALYCALVFLPVFSGYYNFFTTLAVLMLGLYTAFWPITPSDMLRLVIYSNITAFAVGGAAFALFYYSNLGRAIGNVGLAFDNIPLKILAASSCASYVGFKLISRRLSNIAVKKQAYYSVKIQIDELEASLTALLDTGNSLLDPLTSEPVIIAEFCGVRELLPENVDLIFSEHKEDELLELMTAFSKTPFIKRVRIIPFSSLGKQNGMLIGFKPDSVKIISMDADNVMTKEVIIGIYNYSLSSDGSFQALLNPSIL